MKKGLSRAIRFLEIDYQYLLTDFSLSKKLSNLFLTNFAIIKNLITRPHLYTSISIDNKNFYYDTPYATKTFLTAVYDFYMVTMKRKIFSQDDPVIIDIGANIGQFLYATKTLFPKSKVYSVEPDSSVFSILQKNAKNYSGVKIFNNALSKVGKTLKFYISKEFSEWSSLKRLDGKEYREIEVVAVRGDTLFNNVKKVDLLKIDVEGAEYEVLLGMPKLLKRSKYLLLEVSLDRTPTDIGSSKVFRLLLDSNFSIYRIGRMFSAGMGKEQGAVDILFKNMTFNE